MILYIIDLEGGIGIIEILNKSNIIALVGGGSQPKFPKNKVIIWDDLQSKVISEVKFTSDVLAIRINTFHLFVVCKNKVYVFNLNNFQNVDNSDTPDNSKGIFTISSNQEESIIAFPNVKKGYVTVKKYSSEPKDCTFWAHSSGIGCLSLNRDGSLICTCSENGTLVRIFNAETGDVGYEFRRGKDKAEIYSLSFDYDSDFIACTSDRGTVHIFALSNSTPGEQNKEEENKDEEQIEGRKSKHVFQKIDKHEGFFGAISRLVAMPTGYMKAQRSFSQFRIPDVKPFSSFYGDCDNTKIFVISTEAKFYKIDFNRNQPGECQDTQCFDLSKKI